MKGNRVWAGVALAAAATIGGGGVYFSELGQRSVLQAEGGYVHDKNDRGGATNFGVTERVARADGYTGHMRDYTREAAIDLYTRQYVYGPRFDLLLRESPAVGHKVIDAGVNAGQSTAARWLQEALNDLSRGGRDYPKIREDGSIGPATIAAYKSLERVRGRERACKLVLVVLDVRQGYHYLKLGRDADSQSTFVPGWIDHRLFNVPHARCAERVAG